MAKQVIYEAKKNPILGIVIQLILLFLILIIAFFFHVNPLGATISISFLAILILLRTNSQILIYDNSIEIKSVRTFSWMTSKYVADFKDIETVDYDKPDRFLLGYLLDALAAIITEKKGSLILKFKNGTYKKLTLRVNKSEQNKIFAILHDRINNRDK